ncbi:MAG: ABC-2 transporter permease, partial [Tissierellaceae bacterium]|nr:ABC-2 transporter permease [Tissierellaceae bacterium]
DVSQMERMYFLILVIMTYIFLMTPFAFDMKSQTLSMMNSLPLRRKDTVLYRYLSVFVYFLISIIYSGIYLWIINKTGLMDVEYFNLKMIKEAIPYILITASIMFPANFKFGPRLAQIVNAFLFSFTAVATITLSRYGLSLSTKGIMSLMKGPTLFLVVLAIYLISLIISIRLYENRDL